jgi:predicted phosphate transport protein (TIGR00153 family)
VRFAVSFWSIFAPKRKVDFFDLLLQHAEKSAGGCRALVGFLRRTEEAEGVKRWEQEADDLRRILVDELNQTFITPIDPEDIHALASHMDDVLDCIEDAAHRITAYRVDPIPTAVVELCDIIQACAKALSRAFESLEKNGRVIDHCIEINRLEETADQVYRRAVSDLFLNEQNPIHLMKIKEVYEILEDTADRCEDVADALQNVVVKNS